MYLLIIAVICTFPVIDAAKKLSERNFAAKSAVSSAAAICSAILLVITSIMLVDATTNPFLYFRF
jgi:alginate O-acetyltransferase complex protein AlgI